jgi:phosphoribosylformimino-5-aminoimidazole carboxamide ribotide isomerase
MDLYPAIDLRAGRCVRLYQGDFERETAYGTDPVSVARDFRAAGARWLHVVDLDAARTGVAENRAVVARIAAAVRPHTAVQCGGGVRDQASAEALLSCGVDRVVVGTAALENPGFVRELASHHPVAVSLDVRGSEVATRGWTERSGRTLGEVLPVLEDAGVAALVVTDIGRDGTLGGPDIDGLAQVLESTVLDVIASGGVGSLGDLEALATLSAGGRALVGAIVGRALYEGRFTVSDALSVLARVPGLPT